MRGKVQRVVYSAGKPKMTRPDLIPYRIRIGVTGHRDLANQERLAAAVEKILSLRYREAFSPEDVVTIAKASATPIAFTIISPLAEGGDRLVAHAGLAKGALLEAFLPMPPEEYERDFATPESRYEFKELLRRAHRTLVMDCGVSPGDTGYRRKSYRLVGEETVAYCDILIALWDGKEPKSSVGTGAVVEIAVEKGKPVFIVSTSEPGYIELKNGGVLKANFISELNAFNAFQIEPNRLAAYEANEYTDLFPVGLADPLPLFLKEIVRTRLIPAYCRTSLIAKHRQRRYFSTGKRAYIYSTLSVAFMAGAIVFSRLPYLSLPAYMIELALLVLLYLMIHRAVHDRVHHRWLEHRVLAERLRMAFYFVACGETPAASATGMTIHHYTGSWVERAYGEIIYGLPKLVRPEAPPLPVFAKFIHDGWIARQLAYHNDKKRKASWNNNVLKKWGLRCFALAIGVSVIHHLFAVSAAVGNRTEGLALVVEELLSIVAVTLPAAGAAVNGYRSLLDQSRISSRSAGMVYHLERIMNRPNLEDAAGFRHHLERIEDLMLMESQDWHKFMEHAELDNIV